MGLARDWRRAMRGNHIKLMAEAHFEDFLSSRLLTDVIAGGGGGVGGRCVYSPYLIMPGAIGSQLSCLHTSEH